MLVGARHPEAVRRHPKPGYASDRAPRICFLYGFQCRAIPREMYRHINDVIAHYAAAAAHELENVPDPALNWFQVFPLS